MIITIKYPLLRNKKTKIIIASVLIDDEVKYYTSKRKQQIFSLAHKMALEEAQWLEEQNNE
jgi:hypothetical protein